jgi:hypothetical protein
MSDTGRAYDWDDTVENPNEGGGDFVLLPPGEYPFKVVKFERGQYAPSADSKTPACKKAILTLEIDGGGHGTTSLTVDMILHSNFEWKLCQFFKAIGDRKSGEPLTMNWKAVIGKSGRFKLKHRVGTGQYKDKKYNEVDKYLDPLDPPTTTAAAFPAQEPPAWNPEEYMAAPASDGWD